MFKIKSLLKFSIGLIPALYILYKFKLKYEKVILVYMFSSKFGHFYTNTELYLRSQYSNKNGYIFYPEEIIDNKNLLNEWKKIIYVTHNLIGFALSKITNIFNIQKVNLRDYSAINRKEFFKKGYLVKEKKPLKNFFTCSVRLSKYQKLNQLQELDYQSYRDTDVDNFNYAISKFLNEKKNMKSLLINSNADYLFDTKNKLKIDSFSYNASDKIDVLVDKFCKSSFHFGATTGVDTVGFAQNVPCGLYNMILCATFNFLTYPSKCIVSPLLLYNEKNKKYLSLKKNIELNKFMEKNFKKNRFDLEDQKKFNLKYIKNSKDEMYNLLIETHLISSENLILTEEEKKMQELFWKNYPLIEKDPLTGVVMSDQRSFKPLISPYFLNKHRNFYLD